MYTQWIPGYEGRYDIDKYGKVRSHLRSTLKTIKHIINPDGHHMVSLYRNGKAQRHMVHKLVLTTFSGDSELKGLHRDGNPHNNHIDNLYWGTDVDNMRDRINHGNNPNINKQLCPRKHKLDQPNLVSKRKARTCLACSRAKAYHRLHPDMDLQLLSDKYFDRIMA